MKAVRQSSVAPLCLESVSLEMITFVMLWTSALLILIMTAMKILVQRKSNKAFLKCSPGPLHFGERSDVIVTAFSWHFLVINNYVCLEFCDQLQEALGVFTPIQRRDTNITNIW